MALRVRKPILVAGIGLSFGLLLWENLQHHALEIGQWGMMGAIALGTGFWWLQRNSLEPLNLKPLSPLTREKVEEAIAQAQTILNALATEDPNRDVSQLNWQIEQITSGFERQNLKIALTGGKNAGKTTLKQVLCERNITDTLSWTDSEPLFTDNETNATEIALSSDLVLFLVTGDLTESQWQFLQQLHNAYQRLLIVFSKQDRHAPEERALILQQLRQRVQEIIPTEDVIAITAAPQDLSVRNYQADGTVQEWTEAQAIEVERLCDRLQMIVTQQRESLVRGSLWREATQLKQQAKGMLNAVRRDRALPLVEQYQWIAAATAFANPVSALDLLATAAINTQLLIDLSGIYQQKFSLSQAKIASGTIGKLMVQLGLVELSTQAIGALLKSHALTYIAGGAVQGVSAAYLTRIAGLSLIEYLQEQDIDSAVEKGFNFDKFAQTLKQVFERNQRGSFLSDFVKAAIPRLSAKTA